MCVRFARVLRAETKNAAIRVRVCVSSRTCFKGRNEKRCNLCVDRSWRGTPRQPKSNNFHTKILSTICVGPEEGPVGSWPSGPRGQRGPREDLKAPPGPGKLDFIRRPWVALKYTSGSSPSSGRTRQTPGFGQFWRRGCLWTR